jgi:hypothetical protein
MGSDRREVMARVLRSVRVLDGEDVESKLVGSEGRWKVEGWKRTGSGG